MDFRALNEEIIKLLEGDVVSFADFKNRKTAERRAQRNVEFEKQFGDELQKDLDKFHQENILVEIEKVKVLYCEGPKDNPHFKEGEELSYENFQEKIYVLDYINQIKEALDKCDYELYLSSSDGDKQTFKQRLVIGSGKEECDIYTNLEVKLNVLNEKPCFIKNDPVKYNENYYKSLVKEYNIEPPVKEDPMKADYIKDYSLGGQKKPEDVEVGDILYRVGGYSMTYYDYYKVIERKKKSIKLQNIGEKSISGDGWSGKCIPANTPQNDQYVDGKLFRIGYKYAKDVVCSVNGHSLYYWDGKPDAFDRND